MLRSTFQLARGVGPRHELSLWQSGVLSWEEYGERGACLPHAARAALEGALPRAVAAHLDGDVAALAQMVPPGEHWRLFGAFGADAAYLDIETGDDDADREGVSAIGFLDRRGPRLLLAGRGLEEFPVLARQWSMLVTFNGSAFDLPILRRVFPEWREPSAHVDLRHVLARLGHSGGLKAIERRLTTLHLVRPHHLSGLDGGSAGGLFHLGRAGDAASLRRFAEYNLYDAINLRTLMAYAYNALVEAQAARAPALHTKVSCVEVPGRGDVLYDVSKILLAL